jgi:hypothetical protein
MSKLMTDEQLESWRRKINGDLKNYMDIDDRSAKVLRAFLSEIELLRKFHDTILKSFEFGDCSDVYQDVVIALEYLDEYAQTQETGEE